MMSALEGRRVLDLSRGYPGSYCTMFLGDFGAEVLKIDPPGATLRLPFLGIDDEKWAAYYAQERNKRSIILNMKAEEGRQVFYKLVESADVLVEGFRPGVVKQLGIDYEALKGINPRIIYCSLTGYGQSGPYRDLSGHDMNYSAMAGALSLIGERGGRPFLVSNLLADQAGAGLHATIGILLALLARERTGRGQFVDIAFTDGVISLLTFEASTYFPTGIVPKRGETFTTGAAPSANLYETKDGEYISIGCIEPHFWQNLCRALGREDFIPYQFSAGEKREEILSFFREIFLTKTRDEWFELLKEKETCVAPVYNLEETFSNPQVLHRQMVAEVDHPKFGKVKQVGIAIKLSETPGQIKSTGPLPGEHTEEVLLSLGYTRGAIERLRKAEAIG